MPCGSDTLTGLARGGPGRASRSRGQFAAAGVALLALSTVTASASAQATPACADDPAYATLDFWVGHWTVWMGDQQVGTNTIVKVLADCAVEEHWADARGSRGQSLFYYLPSEDEWRQVWVTENAAVPGGVKEKRQVQAPEGSVRFQGTITRPDGATYLDRTTLTPDASGNVRQHIEISTDGGESWRTTFDAEYRPAG
jgi:hypothetical protein